MWAGDFREKMNTEDEVVNVNEKKGKEGKPKAIAVTLDNNLHLPGSVSRGIPFP